MRKLRDCEDSGETCCDMKSLTLLILIVMLVQLVVMLIPLGAGGYIYIQNKENLNALANLSASKIVTDINTFPLAKLGKSASKTASDANFLVHNIKSITGDLRNNTNIFDDMRKVMRHSIEPLDGLKHILSPQMRGTTMSIISKVMRLLNNLNDDELHKLMVSVEKASVQANHLLSDSNINRTLHTMNDADNTMKRFMTILGKFTN